jgi:hypothetical protein
MNSLGASPMKATTFSTRSHLSNTGSSARMAAMVASPTPGIDFKRSLFVVRFGSSVMCVAIYFLRLPISLSR